MDTQQREKEFIRLIKTYQQVIYKVCYVYSTDNEPLNDLYQEVVVNLRKGYPSFRDECKLSTWIYRIALNTCITFFRKSKTRPASVALTTDMEQMADNDNQLLLIKELYRLISQLGQLKKQLSYFTSRKSRIRKSPILSDLPVRT